MTSVHPPPGLLAAYASGQATDGAALAVSSHMTFCPECRAKVEELEAFETALMATVVSEPIAADAGDSLFNRLDDPAESGASQDYGPLPAPLARIIEHGFDDIPWRFLLPGVHEYEISDGEERISLIRAKAGASLPQHTHEGEEITVVLKGELVDHQGCFRAGDLNCAGPEVDHRPKAGDEESCICLTVITGKLNFTGPFGRVLNLFT